MSHYPRFLYSFPEPTWWNGPPSKWDDDPYYFEPACVHCDDAGCPKCCEMFPVTLDDLVEIQADIDAGNTADNRRTPTLTQPLQNGVAPKNKRNP